VTASSAEGWCLSVMEAAASGTPTVALAIGGLPESIDDGRTGLLAQDAEEMAGKLGQLLGDPELRDRLGEAAFERAREFNWDATARATLALLQREHARSAVVAAGAGNGARRPARPAVAESDGFEQTLEQAREIEGWLTDAQAERLFLAGRRVGQDGTIVEIGSYRGRSTITLASAAQDGVEVVAIDPHAGNDRGPQEIEGYDREAQEDNLAFHANLARAGVADHVRHVRKPSQEAFDEVAGDVDLLYVDGAHRVEPASQDIGGWGQRIRPGGTLLIHDSFSSIGVTIAIMRLLLSSRQFRYVGRSGSLAEYRRAPRPLTARQRLGNAARQLAQLPWFGRNVMVKLALVAHLRPLARLLGHGGRDWPY
jgi:predicted O-methyltransferase YrrM